MAVFTVMSIGNAHSGTGGGTSNLANLVPGVAGTGGDKYAEQHTYNRGAKGSSWTGSLFGTDAMLGSAVAMRFDGYKAIDDPHANKPSYVRRPLSGTAVKPNTHAFLCVVSNTGNKVLKVFNDIGSVTPTPQDMSLQKTESDAWMTMASEMATVMASAGEGNLDAAEQSSALADKLLNMPQLLEKATDDPTTAVDAPQADRWTDWFLQQVTEVREEKFQITDTFGETAFNAFGQRPRMLSMRGYLLNTADFNWRAEFWHNWDLYFRATKLIERDAQVYIGWDDIIVSGYPLNATAKQTAESPHIIMFQFSFLVTSYTNMSMKNIGQLQAMRRSGLGAQSGGKPIWLDRSNEFMRTGDFSYADWSSDRGQAMMGKISKIVGGDNMAFQDMTNTLGFRMTMGLLGTILGGTLFGVMGSRAGMSGGSAALAAIGGALAGAEGFSNPMGGLLFDSALRFIKGGSTMMQYISSRIHQKTLQNTNQLTMAAGAGSKGGLPGLNFWFGFVGQLYTVIGVNLCSKLREPADSLYDIGKAGREGAAIRANFQGQHSALYNNRWMKMVDHLVQMGSMQGLLSYASYAQSASIQTSWLKSATAKGSNSTSLGVMQMSNLEYSGNLGFYAAGNSGVDTSGLSYGGDISWDNYGGAGAVGEMQGANFSEGLTEVVNLPPQKKHSKEYWQASADQYASPEWSHPSSGSSDASAADNSLVKDLMTEAEYKKQKEAEAVYAQNNQIKTADGTLVPVETPEDTEDDGTESKE